MQHTRSPHFDQIIANFSIAGAPAGIVPCGPGLINDTYRVHNAKAGKPDYLLQRINHHIFNDVPGLMHNIVQVTAHLKKKLQPEAGPALRQEVLSLLPTRAGRYYHRDEQGNYWRMYRFIAGTRTCDRIETRGQAYESGLAFGRFQALLSDLDSHCLKESIPHFHSISRRLHDLYEALQADPLQRAGKVTTELNGIASREKAMKEMLEPAKGPKLPQRVIHGDTKFSNVLLDEDDKASCVIDLDTVMRGYAACDFGDAIRTIINTAPEDEADTGKIQLDTALFKAYTAGYLSQGRAFLSAQEINSLINGVLLLPYMQAVRFLTDYIAGDRYYKTSFPEHNLQRSRAQLQLLKKLEENYTDLDSMIKNEAAR